MPSDQQPRYPSAFAPLLPVCTTPVYCPGRKCSGPVHVGRNWHILLYPWPFTLVWHTLLQMRSSSFHSRYCKRNILLIWLSVCASSWQSGCLSVCLTIWILTCVCWWLSLLKCLCMSVYLSACVQDSRAMGDSCCLLGEEVGVQDCCGVHSGKLYLAMSVCMCVRVGGRGQGVGGRGRG